MYRGNSPYTEEVSEKAVLSLMEARKDPILSAVSIIISLSSHFSVASSLTIPLLQSLEF